MTSKTVGNLFHAPRNIAIYELKLELSPGNAQIGGKLSIFLPFWPWNFKDDLEKIGHFFYATWSFVNYSLAISEFKLQLQPTNAQFGS